MTQITNREWHFEYWEPDYKKVPYEFAHLYMRAEKLLSDLNELKHKATRIEASRREHAVSMGVPIIESDKTFSMQDIIENTENLVKQIKQNYAEMGRLEYENHK